MLDIDRLLNALDLRELVRDAGAKLNGTGRCRCPLHNGDNDTAFHVYTVDDGRELYTCHTRAECGSGNALTFIKKWKGLEGAELLRFAADRAHLSLTDIGLTPEAVAEHAAAEKRRDVLELAAQFYRAQFAKSETAQAYAAGRGFDSQTCARFGFSAGGGLRDFLLARNGDVELAQTIGLLRHDGADFTANANGTRVSPTGWLVYIHLRGGRVDYLSARALAPTDPKDKSRNLPGHKHIYRAECGGDVLLIVEGQACAESNRQIGLSSWALCGASLSDDDVRALGKRRVVLALDDDTHRDGTDAERDQRRATSEKRTAKLAEQLGPLTLVGFSFPINIKDFNEWLQKKPDEFTRPTVLAEVAIARPWIDERLRNVDAVSVHDIDDVAHELAALVARLPDTNRARYFKRVAKALDISPKELKELVSSGGAQQHDYVLSEIKQNRLCFLGEPLCNWSAHITHEYLRSDGLNPPAVFYKIAGKLADNSPLEILADVTAEEFETMGWVARWGARQVTYVNRGRLHLLARAIKEVSNHGAMKRETIYTYTGWHGEGEARGYISATGKLTANGLDASVTVDLSHNNLRHYALPEPPTGEAMFIAVRASLDFLDVAPMHVSAPLWAAMYAAPLTALRALNAVMWPYGPTQSGKSTITHLALSHFGAGFLGAREFHAPMDWTATVTALEGGMFTAKDAPLVIDDFAPQFSGEGEARELKRKAALVVRSVGNRSARSRSNADLSEKVTRVPRGLVIATAENPLPGQSIVGRMIYVTVAKGDVLREGGNAKLNDAQAAGRAGAYAQAMSTYIKWLCVNWERVAGVMPDLVDGAAAQARERTPRDQGRLPDYYGILSASAQMALLCFSEIGVVPKDEAQTLRAKISEAILNVVVLQAGKVAAESPAQRFFTALASLIERRKVHLAPRRSKDPFTPPERSDLVGWFDTGSDGVVWLSTETCLTWAKSFWSSLDEHLDVPVDAIRRHIQQAGVLMRLGDGGRAEVSQWLGDRTRRALEVDVKAVREIFGVDLRPVTYDEEPAP